MPVWEEDISLAMVGQDAGDYQWLQTPQSSIQREQTIVCEVLSHFLYALEYASPDIAWLRFLIPIWLHAGSCWYHRLPLRARLSNFQRSGFCTSCNIVSFTSNTTREVACIPLSFVRSWKGMDIALGTGNNFSISFWVVLRHRLNGLDNINSLLSLQIAEFKSLTTEGNM